MPQNSLFLLLLQKADEDRYILDKLVTDDNAPVTVFGYDAAPDDRGDEIDKSLTRDRIAVFRAWVLEHVKEQV